MPPDQVTEAPFPFVRGQNTPSKKMATTGGARYESTD